MHLKDYKKNYIFAVLFIAAATVFFLIRGGGGVALHLTDERLTLGGPNHFVAEIPFEEIRSIELRDSMDFGTVIDGSSGRCSYGVWENVEFGRYTLCAMKRIASCIVVTDADGGVTVFNYESAETTKEIGRTLPEYLASLGYLAE